MKTWVLVALLGCRPPEPVAVSSTTTDTQPPQLQRVQITVPRPDIDIRALLPDPTEYGRWPLHATQHPVLEPQFPVADELAQPGITWQALCERGAQNRHGSGNNDVNDYLGAWCAVALHDAPGALYRLGQLQHSTVPSLADAVKRDAANIIVDAGDSTAVEGTLRTAGLLDAASLDLVSATYFEVGRKGDAFFVNELATGLDRGASVDRVCDRLARGIVTAEDWNIDAQISRLQGLSAAQHVGHCATVFDELSCWRLPIACAAYFATPPRNPKQFDLVDGYYHWPYRALTYEWTSYARSLVRAEPIELAGPLIVLALQTAAAQSECDNANKTRTIYSVATDFRDARARAKLPPLPALETLLANLSASHCRS